MSKNTRKPLPKTKPGKKKTMHRAAKVTKDHKPGAGKSEGSEERIIIRTRRALELKSNGYHLHEIGEMLQKEFKLEAPPSVSTVSEMICRARNEALGDIKALSKQFIFDGWLELQAIKRNFLPVATGEVALAINRLERVDGEFQVTLDEDAFKERKGAAEVSIKVVLAQAKLLGIGSDPTQLEGKTPQELQQWLMAFLSGQAQVTEALPVKGKTFDVVPQDAPAAKLVLSAGIPEAADLEESEAV